MAPAWTASPPTPTNKRTASQAGFVQELPNATKLKQQHITQNLLKHKQHVDINVSSICQDNEAIRRQVTRSISLALDAVGFECADPVALESFRNVVEECTLDFIMTCRSSG